MKYKFTGYAMYKNNIVNADNNIIVIADSQNEAASLASTRIKRMLGIPSTMQFGISSNNMERIITEEEKIIEEQIEFVKRMSQIVIEQPTEEVKEEVKKSTKRSTKKTSEEAVNEAE